MTPAGEPHGGIERPALRCCNSERMSPAGLGVLLGALNVLVIAIGMGASVGHSDTVGVAFFVSIVGILPGVVTGACLGALGGALRVRPSWLRVPLLLIPALVVVGMLATTFGLISFAAVSAIPTIVAVLILERCTRERVEPVVPPARVR